MKTVRSGNEWGVDDREEFVTTAKPGRHLEDMHVVEMKLSYGA